MLKSLSFNRTTLDMVAIVAGLGLFLSPWYLDYAAEAYASWNAWIVGAAVVALAAVALFAFHQVEEWANLALGLWTVIAPWAVGFGAVSTAAMVHVVAGLIIATVAAANLWRDNDRPYSTA
jgi:hypothetical protein